MTKEVFVKGIKAWFDGFVKDNDLYLDKVVDTNFDNIGGFYTVDDCEIVPQIARSSNKSMYCQLHNVYGHPSLTIMDEDEVMTLTFAEAEEDNMILRSVNIDATSTDSSFNLMTDAKHIVNNIYILGLKG